MTSRWTARDGPHLVDDELEGQRVMRRRAAEKRMPPSLSESSPRYFFRPARTSGCRILSALRLKRALRGDNAAAPHFFKIVSGKQHRPFGARTCSRARFSSILRGGRNGRRTTPRLPERHVQERLVSAADGLRREAEGSMARRNGRLVEGHALGANSCLSAWGPPVAGAAGDHAHAVQARLVIPALFFCSLMVWSRPLPFLFHKPLNVVAAVKANPASRIRFSGGPISMPEVMLGSAPDSPTARPRIEIPAAGCRRRPLPSAPRQMEQLAHGDAGPREKVSVRAREDACDFSTGFLGKKKNLLGPGLSSADFRWYDSAWLQPDSDCGLS